MPMTDADMKRYSEAWWASHPRVGVASLLPPSATFTAGNFFFDHDGNPGTQVDTARITVGQSVLWQWVAGTHTVTNGTGFGDPNAGTLFDQPSNVSSQQFTFAFNTAGTFPFFCRFHEIENMVGVVVVESPTGVEPRVGNGRGLGFTVEPSPNPTRAGVSFQFALQQAGHARAEVFDARGRLVAVVLDRDLGAGSYSSSWTGRGRSGIRAGPGIYFLRLRIPGLTESRQIVIAR